jgi:two-component system nitrate/nitrite response regulator NarL
MRLLLVGEHVLLLQGLTKLLHDQTGAELRATASQSEAEEAVQVWRPDVVIVETSNVAAASDRLAGLRRAGGEPPLLVIAPGEREQFLAALRSGVRGFVGRDATAEQLLGCIDAVRRGEWGLPRALLGDLAGAYVALATAHGRSHVALTDRERRVLQLLARGATTRRIGQEMFLSEGTIRGEIRALTQKLGVANRVQLVTEAFRLGLADAD